MGHNIIRCILIQCTKKDTAYFCQKFMNHKETSSKLKESDIFHSKMPYCLQNCLEHERKEKDVPDLRSLKRNGNPL